MELDVHVYRSHNKGLLQSILSELELIEAILEKQISRIGTILDLNEIYKESRLIQYIGT